MTGEMNYYKQIVLLSGLEYMNDYNFRALKSLLNHDLKLTKNMQDDYDRIKIADLMEEKFPEDAGLSKLIEVCEDIPELAARVDILRKEMEKVKNKTKIKSESSPLPLTSSLMEAWEVEPAMVTASSEAKIGSHLGATDQLVKDHQFEDNEMQNPQSGLGTGLSDQPRLSRTQSRTEKRRRKQEEQPLATKMKRLSLSPPQTTARRVNPMPTWGQLKKLTREAEGLVQRTGNKLSSETMFLAMLALIAMQSSSEICNYDKAGHSGTSSEK